MEVFLCCRYESGLQKFGYKKKSWKEEFEDIILRWSVSYGFQNTRFISEQNFALSLQAAYFTSTWKVFVPASSAVGKKV